MKINPFIGAVLLVAGTSIGAGMLALPVVTAEYGFFPTVLLFIVSWVAMTFAALCMLEANMWFPKESNLISMAKETLGRGGEIVAWGAYLLLLYSLMSAYISGMNALLISTASTFLHLHLSALSGALILIALFGVIIYLGATTIDYLNRLFMLGLISSYLALIYLISPHVDPEKLLTFQINNIWLALPIIITSFGFQIIIPSLRTYLNSDTRKIQRAIIIGSLIPLIVYLIWLILILGVLPLKGHDGLLQILTSGQPAVGLTHSLERILHNHKVATISGFFVFYAIATSFIGVSFSLFDFLADGLHIKKNKIGRLMTACITFIPPLIFAFVFPNGFIAALRFAGIFVAVLLILLPALLVISGRYWKHIPSYYRAKGGLTCLIGLVIFSFIIIFVEAFGKITW